MSYEDCYECGAYGNDYSEDDEGNLVCNCPSCSCNPANEEEYE